MNGELVQITSGKKKVPETTVRLVATLAVAGLLSGLAIVSAYELTRPMIAANKARAIRRGVFEVVPGAERLQRLAWRDEKLVPAEGPADGEPSVYAGYKADATFLGYAIPGETKGYQDVVGILYGFDPTRRRVIGMYVVETSETPGLGDKIFKDQDFVDAFRDLAIEPEVELVKDGATQDNQVDAITGATVSSRAVVRIINEANAVWLGRLFEPGEVPPLPAGGEESEESEE